MMSERSIIDKYLAGELPRDDFWMRFHDAEELARVRRLLSMHEIRTIMRIARETMPKEDAK